MVASGQLSVLLGNGDGSFQSPMNTSFNGTVLAVGDFNGDGNVDLASAGVRSVFLALGNGNGTFKVQKQVKAYNASVGPLIAADTNRNGKVDLVVGTSKGIGVLLGRGNGQFNALALFGPAANTGGLAVGDFNGDGKPDLVAGTSDLAIFLGRGDGTFRAPRDYLAAGSQYFPAIGDLNHDNHLDVVTGEGTGSSVAVYLGKGDGTLKAPRNFNDPPNKPVGEITSMDANEDGIADLVVDGHVFLGNGDGTFEPPIAIPSLAEPELVGDYNGDGYHDLITFGQNDSAAIVLLSNGDGTFNFKGEYDTGGPPSYATEGDFNGDGAIDLAVVNENNGGNVAVLIGNGDGSFQSPINYPTTLQYTSFVIAGDFNRDGKLDLLVGSDQNSMNLLLGNGNGTFRSPKVINAGGCFAAIPDLNGDKKLDIVLVGCSSQGTNNAVTVLLGNGNGTFQSPVTYTAGASGLLKIRDVNNDGALDVIVPNSQNGGTNVAVLLGNGDGTLRAPQQYVVDGPVSGVVSADFDSDGFADLAVGSGTHASILLNTGH